MESHSKDAIQLTILVERGDLTALEEELRSAGLEPYAAHGHGFDGTAMALAFVALTSAAAKALAGIHAKWQESKKHITYQYKGMKVTGVSEATLLKIVERHTASMN